MMKGKPNDNVKRILHFVPEDSIGAEIGVWRGNSSSLFLERKPKHLHLVDTWSVEPYQGVWDWYVNKYSSVVGSKNPDDFMKYYDTLYESIQSTFGVLDNVTVHRMYSDEFFSSLDDNSLDWIYIDGDHSYEGCLKDLRESVRVVKNGHNILGDDYGNKPGVTRAVDEFVKENGFEFERFRNQWRILNSADV